VSIIENWTDIEGEVREIVQDEVLSGFESVLIGVRKATPVEGFANLLENEVGQRIAVLFPQDLVNELGISASVKLTCRVRKAAGRMLFVHREHITPHHTD
jgi:hypothetical protein